MFQNGIYICISWYRKIRRFPVKNDYVSRTQEVRHEICKLFESFWGKYNCTKFHHSRICATDFREEELFDPSFFHPWAALKRPILNRINLPIYFIYCLLCQKRTWNNIYFFKAMPCRKYGRVFQILYLKETLIVLNCSYN